MSLESQNTDSPETESPKIDNRVRVLILQHPQEKKEPLATVPLLLAKLNNIQIKIGLSWPNLKKALNEDEVDYSEWAVIYLGTQAEMQKLEPSQDQISILGAIKKLNQIKGLIVLDGSWREVKALWWRNPWLLKVSRLILNPKEVSAYSVLRREPRKQSLSTLEAVALVLSEIEARQDIKVGLDQSLNQLISEQKKSKSFTANGKKPDYRMRRARTSSSRFK
jgi:DTW domain-containing protein YfiP